jgi:alpha-mannosidase
MSKRKVLHMIGNAHLDPVWLWRWPEGFEAARATFRSALDRMDEDPDFVFTSSQAAVYQWIERGDPELFERIKQRVREGRWRIVGGWWMQTDCNIPGGESLVRQGLYGQRYFMEKLGVTATVGYNVDSFGHNVMIPQILKKSGMDSYVFMRPGPHENAHIPGRLFGWESPDGSRVLTYQIPESYASWGDYTESKIRRAAEEMEKYPEMMDFYGVGNHGGGPTRENIERVRRLQEDESLPELRFSSPDQFFQSAAKYDLDLPVWRDEMQHHASGCYAAHSEIKKNNRQIEHLLEAAEKFSVVAHELTGLEYPHEDLTHAWQALLFNQFHDIMAGTSIHEAYEDARDLHGLARQIAHEAITFSTGAISAQMDTSGDGIPIVVFSPHSWTRADFCECELHGCGPEISLVDESGDPVPCQVLDPSAVISGGRPRIIFPVEVDPIGRRLYRALPAEAAQENPLTVSETTLENERLRVETDRATGRIARIFDKERGIEVLSGSSSANVIADPSDTWSHGVFRFKDVIGDFGKAEMEVIETGPVRAAIRATSRWNESVLVQTYRLYAGGAFVESLCEVDWREHRKMLKLAFPAEVSNPVATYEIQYGHIRRPADGDEEPGLTWVDVSDDEGGLCLVNDAKYSYDVEGSTIGLTVLRSPVYAHHDPRKLDPNGRYAYIDQGLQEFRYRLFPHSGAWQDALPHRLGCELNSPLIAVVASQHPGSAQAKGAFLAVGAENVIVSVIKRAEDGDGIILRAFETHGQATRCAFKLAHPALDWESDFAPCEIKTFLITREWVREIDLLERDAS